jgi:hypothetical protein
MNLPFGVTHGWRKIRELARFIAGRFIYNFERLFIAVFDCQRVDAGETQRTSWDITGIILNKK